MMSNGSEKEAESVKSLQIDGRTTGDQKNSNSLEISALVSSYRETIAVSLTIIDPFSHKLLN